MLQKPQTDSTSFYSISTWTRRILYVYMFFTVIAIGSDILEYQALLEFKEGAFLSMKESDARQSTVGILQFIIYAVSAISILNWTYRANLNARQRGATQMAFSPGWAIGWYFIPIMNLWKPYQAMREIWQANASPKDWSDQGVSPLLQWWWGLWIISSIASNASLRMTLSSDEIVGLMAANGMMVLSDLLEIPLSIVLIAIIGKVASLSDTHIGQK